jgi:hypothetical protein
VLRWKDPRLAHTGNGVVRYPIEQVWHPRVSIVNETNAVSRKVSDTAEVEPDGRVIYRQRYAGAFTQSLRLRSFPFDRQTFRLQFVAVRSPPNEVQFVPDQDWVDYGLKQAGGIAPSITLPDWTIENWNTKSLNYALTPGFEYSGYVFEFTAVPDVQHYIWKVILPLVLIVIMSWSGFWIDPGPRQLTNQRRRHFDADADRLSLCRGHPGAAAALHDANRPFLSRQHTAGFLFPDRSFGDDDPR